MSKRTVLALGIVTGLTLVGLWQPATSVWSMGSRVPAVGVQAEDFHLTDLDGTPQSLSQYRGKIVLVN
ncbi:MAG: TlpA family protein disulfide reductase, partial [Nitrospirae bacterium]|nr:TlpA family protein disulfide reductase [Nitrospirota bacterium]